MVLNGDFLQRRRGVEGQGWGWHEDGGGVQRGGEFAAVEAVAEGLEELDLCQLRLTLIEGRRALGWVAYCHYRLAIDGVGGFAAEAAAFGLHCVRLIGMIPMG